MIVFARPAKWGMKVMKMTLPTVDTAGVSFIELAIMGMVAVTVTMILLDKNHILLKYLPSLVPTYVALL